MSGDTAGVIELIVIFGVVLGLAVRELIVTRTGDNAGKNKIR